MTAILGVIGSLLGTIGGQQLGIVSKAAGTHLDRVSRRRNRSGVCVQPDHQKLTRADSSLSIKMASRLGFDGEIEAVDHPLIYELSPS